MFLFGWSSWVASSVLRSEKYPRSFITLTRAEPGMIIGRTAIHEECFSAIFCTSSISSSSGLLSYVFPPSQDLHVDHVSDLSRKLGPKVLSHIVDLDCSLRESIFMTALLTPESSTKQKYLAAADLPTTHATEQRDLKKLEGIYVLMIYRLGEGI